MEVRDVTMGMCMPIAMAGMSMKMAMIHYNSFFVQTFEEGPRGRTAFSVPNNLMVDLGQSVGERNFINLDLMATLERWTFPTAGTPELLQIGEQNQDQQPFIDAQHPHSSPIMGLTLSDTLTLDATDYAKFSFAPRGQSTDGPIAFMHRPTGMINPDAPLGHHIGQDVGHISSTVLAASVHVTATNVEISTFNGTEPAPTNVDLPLGALNSYAARVTQDLTPHVFAMVSAAFLKNPEPTEPNLDHVWRYSASLYDDHDFASGWKSHNALIYGLINFYDHTGALNSFTEEFWFQKENKNIWSRIEYLQRTPSELQIASTSPNDQRWVTALTLGYTHRLAGPESGGLGLGTSITKDLLPTEYQSTYSGNPLTVKIFLQLSGMKMRDL